MKIFDPKLTGSIAFENAVQGNIEITGDLVVPGSITAREFKTEFVSASIIYQSGSTQFGNSADDTHVFTGNVAIGTATPARLLHVLKSGDNEVARFESNASDSYLELKNSGTTNNVLLGSLGDDFKVHTGGSERLRIDSNGNVGIGINSVASTLHVKTSTDSTLDQGLVIERSVNSDRGYINYQGGGFQFRATDGDPLVFGQVSDQRMRIGSDGNVGINRTTPSYRLDVGGGSGFRDTLRVLANDVNTVNLSWTAANTGLVNLYHGGTLTTQLIANGTSYFTGGNVGIGTVSAQTGLHVYGSAGSQLLLENTVNSLYSELILRSQDGSGYIWRAASGYNGSQGGGNTLNIYNSGGRVSIGTDTGTNALNVVSGSVGVGTASPEDGLHVYGPGNGKGLTVEATDGQEESAVIKLYPKATSANERNWAIATYRHSSEDLSFTSGNAKGDDPYTAGTTRLLIDGINGYVGIGNTNPVRKLVISNNGANGIELDPNIAGNSEIISYNRSTSSYTPLHFEASRFALLNGNVGIANTSPTYYSGYKMLHIGDGTTGNTGIIKLGTGSTANGPELYAATVGGVNRLLLNTDSSTNVMVLNGSNVGIGTDSPASTRFTDANNRIVDIRGNAINRGGLITLRTSDSSKEAFIANDGGQLQIGMYTENDISLYSNNLQRMLIDRSGIVHIGRDNSFVESYVPSNMFLSISGRAGDGTDGAAGIHFMSRNTASTNWHHGYISLDRSGHYRIGTGGLGTTPSSDKVIIKSDGNVGIGTTNPAYPLHIYDADDSPLLLEGSNQWTGIKWKDQSGQDWMWFNGSTQTFAIGGGGSSANSNKKLHVEGAVSVGVGFNNEPLRDNSLSVRNSVRIDDADINWYQSTIPDSIAYWHLKTDMWAGAGPTGNIDYTMSLFTGRAYFYSPAMILEGSVGFHNWSNTIYNAYTTGNLFSSPYVSSDGYVVLVINTGSRTYGGLSIDWYQSYQYPYRLKKVVATTGHSAATGAF